MRDPAVLAAYLLLALIAVYPAREITAAQESRPEGPERMVRSAREFLEALSPELRSRAGTAFDNAERGRWNFFPHGLSQKVGVNLSELDPAQRKAGHHLLNSALSSRGYLKASGIVHLDDILQQALGPNPAPGYSSGYYWLTVFGVPGSGAPWGWRFEGHHLSLNFTLTGRGSAATPLFMGSNPAEVQEGPYAGWRILAGEEDLARRLVLSLNETQRVKALFSADTPGDIINGPGREKMLSELTGVPAAGLDRDQRSLLLRLVAEYVGNLEEKLAREQMDKIEAAGLDKIHFGWAGGTRPGERSYFRVQGPTFLIEFDNSRPGAGTTGPNHIHTVWRDLENDFGRDLLRQHYEQSAHHRRDIEAAAGK